jgi:hypothetical protein
VKAPDPGSLLGLAFLILVALIALAIAVALAWYANVVFGLLPHG